MKIGGILALLFALVVGGWVVKDYWQNESDRRVNEHAIDAENRLNAIMEGDSEFSPKHAASMHAKEIESAEQYDAIMGIVACVILIGGIVLLSKSAKPVAGH